MLTLLGEGEGNTASRAMQVAGRFSGVTDPVHVLMSSARNLGGPKRGSWQTTDREARSEACWSSDWEVGRSHSSEEADEQSVLTGVAEFV